MRSAWLAVLVLSLGAVSAPACKPAAEKSASCRQRAQALARALRKLSEPPRVELLTSHAVPLVSLPGARYAGRQLVITLRRLLADGAAIIVDLEGSEVADLPDGRWTPEELPQRLVSQLKTHWDDWRVVHPGQRLERELLVAAGPDIPWRVVVGLLRGLSGLGVRRVGMLVAVPDPSPPLPASRATPDIAAFRAELQRGIDPSQKAPLLGAKTPLQRRVEAHWKRATRECPQIERALAQVGPVAPEHKGRVLIAGLEQALNACRCRADLPSIQARVHLMLHRAPTGVVWFQHQPRGKRLARPADEPWRDTVQRWLRRHPRELIRGRLVATPPRTP